MQCSVLTFTLSQMDIKMIDNETESWHQEPSAPVVGLPAPLAGESVDGRKLLKPLSFSDTLGMWTRSVLHINLTHWRPATALTLHRYKNSPACSYSNLADFFVVPVWTATWWHCSSFFSHCWERLLRKTRTCQKPRQWNCWIDVWKSFFIVMPDHSTRCVSCPWCEESFFCTDFYAARLKAERPVCDSFCFLDGLAQGFRRRCDAKIPKLQGPPLVSRANALCHSPVVLLENDIPPPLQRSLERFRSTRKGVFCWCVTRT